MVSYSTASGIVRSNAKIALVLYLLHSYLLFRSTNNCCNVHRHYVGDATFLEAALSFTGFISLLLLTAFELDVVPDKFLEQKLMVTIWLIQKLDMAKEFPFRLSPHSEEFLSFIRHSRRIYHLYDEDLYISNRGRANRRFRYDALWSTLHMLGAIIFVALVTTSILLNDMAEEKVAWIAGAHFFFFCFISYLTGAYVPLINFFKCWIMLWNPFLKDPMFLLELKRVSVLVICNNCSWMPYFSNRYNNYFSNRYSPFKVAVLL